MGIIGILVSLVIIAIIIYAVVVLVNFFPIPQPIKTLIFLIVGVVALVWVLDAAGIYHVALR